jgi:LacI family transcriptional regulator
VPEDVALVDLSLFATDGSIAGMRPNSRRVGEVALELVATQLQQNVFGLPAFPSTTLIDGTWCDGASLPVPARRPPVTAPVDDADLAGCRPA